MTVDVTDRRKVLEAFCHMAGIFSRQSTFPPLRRKGKEPMVCDAPAFGVGKQVVVSSLSGDVKVACPREQCCEIASKAELGVKQVVPVLATPVPEGEAQVVEQERVKSRRRRGKAEGRPSSPMASRSAVDILSVQPTSVRVSAILGYRMDDQNTGHLIEDGKSSAVPQGPAATEPNYMRFPALISIECPSVGYSGEWNAALVTARQQAGKVVATLCLPAKLHTMEKDFPFFLRRVSR